MSPDRPFTATFCRPTGASIDSCAGDAVGSTSRYEYVVSLCSDEVKTPFRQSGALCSREHELQSSIKAITVRSSIFPVGTAHWLRRTRGLRGVGKRGNSAVPSGRRARTRCPRVLYNRIERKASRNWRNAHLSAWPTTGCPTTSGEPGPGVVVHSMGCAT